MNGNNSPLFEEKKKEDLINEETRKKNEHIADVSGSEYEMIYPNIEDCVARLNTLIERLEYKKGKVNNNSSETGMGKTTNALKKVESEYNKIWNSLLTLFEHTKDTVSCFEEISKNADQAK